jgi:hypothetical protein
MLFGYDVFLNSLKKNIGIMVMVVLVFTGCSIMESDPSESELPAEEANFSGNIANSGIFAHQGDWIFYANTDDFGSLYKIHRDGILQQKLTDERVQYINVSKTHLYYRGDQGFVYRMNTDGSERTVFIEQDAMFIQIIEEWLYFIDATDNQLYRMRTDDKTIERIVEDPVSLYQIVGTTIYYMVVNHDYHINIVNTDGTHRRQFTNDPTKHFQVQNNWLYYQNLSDNNRIYRIHLKLNTKEMITNENANYMIVQGPWIYYQNLSDQGTLYKININGHEKTKLMSHQAKQIHLIADWVYYVYKNGLSEEQHKIDTKGSYSSIIVPTDTQEDGDWMYYANQSNHGYLYKIRTDGTLRTQLNQIESSQIVLKGDWLHFIQRGNEDQEFRIRKDGTEQQPVN